MQSPKRREVEEGANWSKLCRDVLVTVFERLSATDFDRAKSVCSAWRSVSRESTKKQNRIPWLILFPYERSYGNSCRLFNPTEEGLVYRTRNLGREFTESRCIATCGSWLLMFVTTHQPKLYILNPLTRERINLPSLDSRRNDTVLSPEEDGGDLFRSIREIFSEFALTEEVLHLSYPSRPPVLWVDERSKDYLVVWSHHPSCLFFSKKGFDFWRMFSYLTLWLDSFAYKDHMLYICSPDMSIEIYDFSGDFPVAATPHTYIYPFPRALSKWRKLVVTTSGDVLMVDLDYITTTFLVYKMNHADKRWDPVASLGDQALILDLGITVPAKDTEGIKADSIYYSGHSFGTNNVFVYSLATRKVEPFMSWTRKFFDARWFIPNV